MAAVLCTVGQYRFGMSASWLALGLGFLHGFDADHVAAIVALAACAGERTRGLGLVLLYAVGHAMVVVALGTAALAAGVTLPAALEAVLAVFVGVSLVGLGVVALVRAARSGTPLQSHPPSRLAERLTRVPRLGAWGGAFAVGVVHGLAGATPTQLAALAVALTPGGGVAALGVFSAGVLGANALLGWAVAGGAEAAAGRATGRAAAAGAGAFALGVGGFVLVGVFA